MQKILEAKDHKARCKLLQFFIDAERKRLSTKKSLNVVFSTDNSAFESSMPAEENIDDSDKESTTKPRSIFTDEPDAFQ
jgi:hypothetical protein